MNDADFALIEEERVLRVIALALAVWARPKNDTDALTAAASFLKFLKGEAE